jgi:2-(1,2-epoxy-1,2-dihydrophenyl)acetyl-CoA isomerase
MGIKAAKRLAFLGESIQSKEALELGIVTKIVPDAEVSDTARALSRRLAKGPSVALAGTKFLLNEAAYPTFVDMIAHEATMVARATAHDDFQKGIEGALAKKPPQFG